VKAVSRQIHGFAQAEFYPVRAVVLPMPPGYLRVHRENPTLGNTASGKTLECSGNKRRHSLYSRKRYQHQSQR
jgi:hypothetical protein